MANSKWFALALVAGLATPAAAQQCTISSMTATDSTVVLVRCPIVRDTVVRTDTLIRADTIIRTDTIIARDTLIVRDTVIVHDTVFLPPPPDSTPPQSSPVLMVAAESEQVTDSKWDVWAFVSDSIGPRDSVTVTLQVLSGGQWHLGTSHETRATDSAGLSERLALFIDDPIVGAVAAVEAAGIADTITIPGIGSPPDTVSPPPADTTTPPPPPPPTDTLTPPPPGTVSPMTPHRRWIRFGSVDYRIHYRGGLFPRDDASAAREYDWAAANMDHVTGGTVDEYLSRNPTLRHAVYDIPYGRGPAVENALEQWLQNNGYAVESAFLHRNGQRLRYVEWQTTMAVAFNPGDPGFRAWRSHRTAQLLAAGADLVFWDVTSRNAIDRFFGTAPIDEYPNRSSYYTDLEAVLREQATLAPAGFNVCNFAAYYNKVENRSIGQACGGVMAEFSLSPYIEQKWATIDWFTERDIVVEYSTGISPGSVNNRVGDLTFGNYTSYADRTLMWMYSACLLTTPAARPDLLVCETYSKSWSLPFTQMFRDAFDVDVGLGLEDRRICQSGTDGAGQPYDVHCREMEDALVLIRPQKTYREKQYGDQTAVTVPLPACTTLSGSCQWRMLNADGSQGPPLTTVQLRNAEAVILVRG